MTGGRLAMVLAAAWLAGCSLAPAARAPVDTWDFGPRPGAPATKLSGTFLVQGVSAPAWLDSAAIVYRLAYVEANEPRSYAGTRWVSPPSLLLTERLRASIAAAGATVLVPGDGARAARSLRVDLEEFSQTFDSPSASRAVVHLRATLSTGGSASQKLFAVELPAQSPDARGAALALGRASSRVVDEIVAWAAAAR